MPIGPEGIVVEGPVSDDEEHGAVGGAARETEGRSGTGGRHCGDHRRRLPGPIDELIAALREATLGPAHPRCHGLDPLPDC